jgi:hypothetical protein
MAGEYSPRLHHSGGVAALYMHHFAKVHSAPLRGLMLSQPTIPILVILYSPGSYSRILRKQAILALCWSMASHHLALIVRVIASNSNPFPSIFDAIKCCIIKSDKACGQRALSQPHVMGALVDGQIVLEV